MPVHAPDVHSDHPFVAASALPGQDHDQLVDLSALHVELHLDARAEIGEVQRLTFVVRHGHRPSHDMVPLSLTGLSVPFMHHVQGFRSVRISGQVAARRNPMELAHVQ